MNLLPQSLYKFFLLAAILLIHGCASVVTLEDRPPLHQAALLENVDEVRRHLQNGANPNELDSSGFPAILWAAMSKNGKSGKEMIELMGKHGANPNATTDTAKMTPLHFVKSPEAVDALVKLGANVNIQDISQGTPLHNTKEPKVALALLKHGANPRLKNISGKTPAEAIRASLQYYRGEGGVMATLRKQAKDTAEAIENYREQSPSDSDRNDSSHPQDEFLMVVEGDAINTNSNDVPTHYSDSNYQPSRASVSSESEINTYTGMTFHENARQTSVDISLGTPAVTTGASSINDVPPVPAYYSSDDSSSSNYSDQVSQSHQSDNFTEDDDIDFDAAEKEAEKLEAAQVCPMQSYDWYYTGKDCKNELAHGNGKAINPFEGMRFEGLIEAGQPAKGTLYRNNKEVFEGAFKDGKPNGEGICFYQGEPEECKYYKGKRIDSLHKQRQEFERQRKLMSSPQSNFQPSSNLNESNHSSAHYYSSNQSTERSYQPKEPSNFDPRVSGDIVNDYFEESF